MGWPWSACIRLSFFEKNAGNVRRVISEMSVDHPLVLDNDYVIWRAFDNETAALYFIDASGRIRHHVFGEGEYEQSERVIQQLLTETGKDGAGHGLVSVDARGPEAAADWSSLGSDCRPYKQSDPECEVTAIGCKLPQPIAELLPKKTEYLDQNYPGSDFRSGRGPYI
jgi:hypothetical protein